MAALMVRGKKKRIYIRTRFNGRQICEPSDYYCSEGGKKKCKCRGCKGAYALGMEIDRKIKDKTFVMREYFPNSKALAKMGLNRFKNNITFNEYATSFLDIKKGVVRSSSYGKLKQAIMLYAYPLLGDLQMIHIIPSHIRNVVNIMINAKLAPKTIKNNLSSISSLFSMATEDKIIPENPCKNIKTPHCGDTDPDPFTIEEVNKILEWLKQNYPNKAVFYAIGFYSGMRPGEIMGLKWDSIDFVKRQIKISRQHTGGEQVEITKTGRIRFVDILPQLLPFLAEQKRYTFLKSEFLLLNKYGRPHKRSEDFNEYYWKPCLNALGIRHRTIYHMRHTFACIMLNNNMPPNWIAKKMLGHTTTELLFRIYGNYWHDLTPPKEGFDF
jgi:integrase